MISNSGKECPASESECQTTWYIGSRLFILNNTERNLSTEYKQILLDFSKHIALAGQNFYRTMNTNTDKQAEIYPGPVSIGANKNTAKRNMSSVV